MTWNLAQIMAPAKNLRKKGLTLQDRVETGGFSMSVGKCF